MTTFLRASLLVVFLLGCRSESRAPGRDTARAVVETATKSSGSADSAKMFGQAFYDWYVPIAIGSASATRYDSITARRSDFAPSLYDAFLEDVRAQRADTVGDIVSVSAEADPFLASQDPCKRYEVRDARARSGGYALRVYATCQNAPAEGPAIVAEVDYVDGRWRFANFWSAGDSSHDLLSELRASAAERAKPGTESAKAGQP